ncbi:MAG: hypothetical protein LBL43_01130, partial [Treponema sp.]|nr:hypothetical protein [Treponema sp.]
MSKRGTERRNYSKEFKAEAAALGAKREKPIGRIADDLGVNSTKQAERRIAGTRSMFRAPFWAPARSLEI